MLHLCHFANPSSSITSSIKCFRSCYDILPLKVDGYLHFQAGQLICLGVWQFLFVSCLFLGFWGGSFFIGFFVCFVLYCVFYFGLLWVFLGFFFPLTLRLNGGSQIYFSTSIKIPKALVSSSGCFIIVITMLVVVFI